MGPHRFPFRAARAPRYLSLGYIEFTFEDFFAMNWFTSRLKSVSVERVWFGLLWCMCMLLVDPSRLRYADSDVAAANGGVIPGPNRFSLEFDSHSPIVSIERMVFYRERAAAGMYSAMPYVVAQAI
uniref:Uncharacterized protein n=1 Tax=Zea mays TaxID=4577 RepID=A0A804RF62_MAIZE